MVGRELTNLFPERNNVPGDVVFEVENFTSINPRSFRNVSFQLRKGEILGVGGLVGAQRTELMEGLFGLRSLLSFYGSPRRQKAEYKYPHHHRSEKFFHLLHLPFNFMFPIKICNKFVCKILKNKQNTLDIVWVLV
jgi:ABC-type sugar transport system ATPase subunit